MKYIPQSASDQKKILSTLGLNNPDDIFESIPKDLKLSSPLKYPAAQSEIELRRTFEFLAKTAPQPSMSFAGCGIYHHDVPSIVGTLQSRSEFATAYTPYQPEISQGTLQVIFEYQTMACQLMEMELSNASLYDGATSLAEALLMGLRIKKNSEKKILITGALHPHYLQVLTTYSSYFKDRFEILPLKENSLDLQALESKLSDADFLITQSPNIFGVIEHYDKIAALVEKHKTFWITSTMEPISLGLLKGPGAFGAQISTAEGQSFGNAPYLGGSTFGIFCTKQDYLRQLPGRLVGETVDQLGRRSYTLTFATREQFIRRDKATSNICTNHNLNMLGGVIHMATLGKEGLRQLALRNYSLTEHLKSLLKSAGLNVSDEPTFNEFVLTTKKPAAEVIKLAENEGFVPGVNLGVWNDSWKHKLLIHVSELHTVKDLQTISHFLAKNA